jgi:hypothetical protein
VEFDGMARRATIMNTLLILLLAIMAPVAARGDDLAGHYVLRGVMEVGSELLLKPDGTFEFMLAYGAADYWPKARGVRRVMPSSLTAPAKRFYFEINGEAIAQVLFKNERLKIEEKGLVMTHGDADHPMRYEKE